MDVAGTEYLALDLGADPTGRHTSTYALQAAANQLGDNGGGDLALPAGVYIIDEQINLPAGVTVSGPAAGVATISGGIADGASFSVQGPAGAPLAGIAIRRLTFDLGGVTNAAAIGAYSFTGLTIEDCVFSNTAFKFIQNYVSTQAAQDNADLVLRRCTFGTSTAPGSAELVTLANTAGVTIDDCTFASGRALAAIDVLCYQLVSGLMATHCTFENSFAYSLSCNQLTIEDCDIGNLTGANSSDHGTFGHSQVEGLRTVRCRTTGGGNWTLGSVRGYRDVGSTIEGAPNSAVTVQTSPNGAAPADLDFDGTTFRSNDTGLDFGVVYLNGAGDLALRLRGCVFDDPQATPTQGAPINLASPGVYQNVVMEGCAVVGGSSTSPWTGAGSWGRGCRIAGCPGLNPSGLYGPPAVPASGAAYTNPTPFSQTVYITGGTVTAIAVDGAILGITAGPVRLPAGSTITLTYSAAPTWTWIGE